MAAANDNLSVADILGQWVDPDWESGLISRCKQAWNKPLRHLSRQELATLLRQKIAVDHLLPVARKHLESGVDDNTEMFEGELEEAICYAAKMSP